MIRTVNWILTDGRLKAEYSDDILELYIRKNELKGYPAHPRFLVFEFSKDEMKDLHRILEEVI